MALARFDVDSFTSSGTGSGRAEGREADDISDAVRLGDT
jgi:hypothetical protein